MRDFLKELEINKYKKVAIVSHRIPQLALNVILLKLSWKDAIDRDWRVCGRWQLGWRYVYSNENL